MKDCKRYKIKITGKVQGVWFRKYTMDKALELGLKGYVMNQPDGSVFTEAESSDPAKLKAFVDWLYTGSPLSKVDQVEILEEKDWKG